MQRVAPVSSVSDVVALQDERTPHVTLTCFRRSAFTEPYSNTVLGARIVIPFVYRAPGQPFTVTFSAVDPSGLVGIAQLNLRPVVPGSPPPTPVNSPPSAPGRLPPPAPQAER